MTVQTTISAKLQHDLQRVIAEVPARYGQDFTPENVKDHLTDRWPWFTAYGIESRMEMARIQVTAAPGGTVQADAQITSRVTVSVKGMKLEGK